MPGIGIIESPPQSFLTKLLMEEILHQLIGSLSHYYLQCVLHPSWCRISSINSNLDIHQAHPASHVCVKQSFPTLSFFMRLELCTVILYFHGKITIYIGGEEFIL